MGYSYANRSTYEGKYVGGRRYQTNNRRRNSPQRRTAQHTPKYSYPSRAQEYNECNTYQEYSHCSTQESTSICQYENEYAQQYVQSYEYNQQYTECYEIYSDDKQNCCLECCALQAKRADEDYQKGRTPAVRKDHRFIERLPGQATPGNIGAFQEKKAKNFTHNPYCLAIPSENKEYYAYEDAVEEIPKSIILCLRWVNGTCGQKRNAPPVEIDAPFECPYAHPDLSEVPAGVCPTFWFTGFCRFDRRETTQDPEDESFGLHGWMHYKRLEPNYSQTIANKSSNDNGEKNKKESKNRHRPPSICYSCHHARPAGGHPLLPGISCKTTVLERETALALYPKWY